MGKKFKKKFWGGFVDNKLHVHQMDTGFGGIGSGSGLRQIPAIFTNWKSARQQYQDVRSIEIAELVTSKHETRK